MADIVSNYVKFRRGTPAAFKALATKDSDTLYFIYEEDESVSELYLGSKLIANSCDGEGGAFNLKDLLDVFIDESIDTNHCLVYDVSTSKWINKPIMSVIDNFVGANATSSGVPGLVPAAPAAGATGLFLRSDGQWAEVVMVSAALVLQTVLTTGETHLAAINRAVQASGKTPQAGDIVIVKDLICGEDNYQHIAYVYDGTNWVAMDGNYDAENVYLANNLTITADIGVQKLNGAGSKTLETAGKNLKQVLDMILASRTLPTYTAPSVSVTPTGTKEYEVGTTVDVAYSATFNDGKYSYNPGENTGVTVSSWKASFNGEELTTASGTFSVTLDDNFNKRVTVTATYGAGVAPSDNLGNVVIDEDELKTCQIQAGSKSGYTGYVKSYRNTFYGSFVNPITITGANIRNLSTTKALTGSFDMDIVEGATQVIIAVPAKHTVPTVADENAFGTNIAEKFVDSTVSVAGASEGYDTDYTVYVYSPSAALGANTYTVSVV